MFCLSPKEIRFLADQCAHIMNTSMNVLFCHKGLWTLTHSSKIHWEYRWKRYIPGTKAHNYSRIERNKTSRSHIFCRKGSNPGGQTATLCAAGKDDPVLLFLDNHASLLGIQGLDYPNANGVILLSLPTRRSDKPQWLRSVWPLDKKLSYRV